MNERDASTRDIQVNNDIDNRSRELPIMSNFLLPPFNALMSISKLESLDALADISGRWQEDGIPPFGIDSYRSIIDTYEGAHQIGLDYARALLDEGEMRGILDRGLGGDALATEYFYMVVKLCDEYLVTDPEDADALLYKAEGLQGLGMLKEATEACDRIIELHPDDLDAWLEKALVLQQRGMDCEAMEAFEKVIKLITHILDRSD
jgi:tetratricopeptide (TPR) repeat protein